MALASSGTRQSSIFAFSQDKKERKPPKPCASQEVRGQNPLYQAVPEDSSNEPVHSLDEVGTAPEGAEKPTRLNSSLEDENAC